MYPVTSFNVMLRAKDFDPPPLTQLEDTANHHADWEVIRGIPDLLIRSRYNEDNMFLCLQPDGISIDVYVACSSRADPRVRIEGRSVTPTTTLTVEDFEKDLLELVEPDPYLTFIELTPDDVGNWVCGCGLGG